MNLKDRRVRNRMLYVEWMREHALSKGNKFGTREQVMSGERFCTLGELVKDELFLDGDKVKARGLSHSMRRVWAARQGDVTR